MAREVASGQSNAEQSLKHCRSGPQAQAGSLWGLESSSAETEQPLWEDGGRWCTRFSSDCVNVLDEEGNENHVLRTTMGKNCGGPRREGRVDGGLREQEEE